MWTKLLLFFYYYLVWLVLIRIIVNTLYFFYLVNTLSKSIMKSKKMSHHKVPNSYNKPNKRVVWLSSKENTLISTNRESHSMLRWQKVDLVFYYFLSHFYFSFDLFFIFSIFRTLGLWLEVIDHISHIWWYDHNIDHRT